MSEKNKKVEEATSPVTSKLDTVLPLAKVKVIMKSSPEVEQIGNDALFLITKSTELFIAHLASKAHDQVKGNKGNLGYKQLSDYVGKDDSMLFLRDIIPAKIQARTALQEVAKRNSIMNKEILE